MNDSSGLDRTGKRIWGVIFLIASISIIGADAGSVIFGLICLVFSICLLLPSIGMKVVEFLSPITKVLKNTAGFLPALIVAGLGLSFAYWIAPNNIGSVPISQLTLSDIGNIIVAAVIAIWTIKTAVALLNDL